MVANISHIAKEAGRAPEQGVVLNESGYILVVDDDASVAEVITLILVDEGYEVTSVRDGARALKMIQARPPSMILLDLSISDLCVEDLVAAYRQMAGDVASIIIVSGRSNVEQRAEDVRADAFLAKPFDVPILIDTVQAILSVRKREL